MYVRTSFRGAKKCAKLEKRVCFLVTLMNFGKDMKHKSRKMHAEMRI